MTTAGTDVRNAFAAALADQAPAAALADLIGAHFPEVQGFRENDDLVVLGDGTHRILARRTGADRFLVSENVAASGSTNLLDDGEGREHDLDGLIAEIRSLADR